MTLASILGIDLSPLGLAKDLVRAFFSLALSAFGAAAARLVHALLGFVATTSEPIFSGGWWTSAGQAVFDRVLVASGSLLALAFMISIVTAVVSGDHRLLARAARRLPVAVIEMALLVAVTAALISASDEIAASITHGATSGLATFASVDLATAISVSGLVGLLAGGLVVLAGLVIWLELICRTALVYVAVMCGPLIFAASVHPSAHGLKRRYVEAGLALIGSKVVVALALATGSAMLSGLGSSPSFAAAVGALLEALAVLLVACFAPFLLLRLLLGAEAIVAAEGLERRPGRALMQGAALATTAGGVQSMLRGLGGGGGAGAGAAIGGAAASGRGPTTGGGGSTPSGPKPRPGSPPPAGGSGGGGTPKPAAPTSSPSAPRDPSTRATPRPRPAPEAATANPPATAPPPSPSPSSSRGRGGAGTAPRTATAPPSSRTATAPAGSAVRPATAQPAAPVRPRRPTS